MITQQINDVTAELATYLSLAIMLVAIIVYLVLSRRLYKNYQKTQSVYSKWLCLFFVSTPLAIIFLIMELTILKILTPDGITSFQVIGSTVTANIGLDAATINTLKTVDLLGWLFATIAIFFSSLSSTIINLFALGFLDPKWKKIAIIPAILAFAYWILHSFGSMFLGADYHHMWIQEYTNGTWDMSYTTAAETLHIPLLVLPLAIATLILLYVSLKVRVKGRPAFIRAFLIALGMLILSMVYIFEVITPHPIMTAIFRLGFVYFPLHMYVCLISPDWFKNLIGLSTS
ncbi:MAG: hypothetical protein ACTSP4_10170 [Candidatus Hodarchaeales archaeon]